ncbi:serine/threonine-protein kinase [Streptosporangium saharense]|uniref:serine/threonine-protein kinase n=1 Tax=Streptosporangium saharense TaxID=1706840 RepID=UPI0036C9DB4E
MPDAGPLRADDPRRIGVHELLGVLGSGGQGTVYLGRDPSGRRVAVKVLHTRVTENTVEMRRFEREVALARQVAAFCTATVLEAGFSEGRPYLVSEYVPGPSLQDLVATDGPRTGSGLERLAIATATALEAIHRAGIVHRDFKPTNVIMGPEGPVVIDFGIARILESTDATTVSALVGTPAYLAPEQLANQPASGASDLFSWAATMVYAATGRRAFAGEHAAAIMGTILNSEPDLEGVPEPLRALLAACLAKDPRDRPGVGDVLAVLTGRAPAEPYGMESDAVTPLPAVERDLITTGDRPVRRLLPRGRTGWAVAAACVALAVLGAVFWPFTTRPGVSAAPAAAVAVTPGVIGNQSDDIWAVAAGQVDGRPVVVSGSADDTARVWDPVTRQPVGEPLRGHTEDVCAVAVAQVDGRPMAVTGSADDTIRVWDLVTRQPVGEPLRGHTEDVYAVAVAQVNGRSVVVSGGGDDTVRVWDLTTREPVGEPMRGHTDDVWTVAIGQVDGRPVAVTGGTDDTIRVWDLTTRRPVGEPLRGHTGDVYGVVVTQLGGRPVVVSAGADRTVRVWDLATHQPVGQPMVGHTDNVTSVAVGQANGRPVAVTGSWDRNVRVWDLTTRRPVGEPFSGHTSTVYGVAVTQVKGRAVAISGSRDTAVRIWDLGPAS